MHKLASDMSKEVFKAPKLKSVKKQQMKRTEKLHLIGDESEAVFVHSHFLSIADETCGRRIHLTKSTVLGVHLDEMGWSPSRKRKTKNCFLNFCDIVLEYTQYENMRREDLRTHNTSPLDSGGSTAESFGSDSLLYATEDELHRTSPNASGFISTSPESGSERPNDRVRDNDSFESITCFCRKPFAGRPMIECNKCLTWIHLSCAKIRRNNIPEEFTCQRCREARSNKRKSNRVKLEKLSPVVQSSPSPIIAATS